MRVLYILHSTQTTSGATKALLGIAFHLEAKDIVPIFIVPDKNGVYNTLLNSGYETYCITFKLSIYPNFKSVSDKITFFFKLLCRIIINIYALTRMKKLIKQLHPDLIHTNTNVVSIGRLAATHTHIPHIQHIREYAEYGSKEFSMHYFPTWKYIHKALKKNNSCNICITKDIQRHHELIGAKNTVVVYDGVHNSVQHLPHKNKEAFFLYAGRVEHIKGLDILLRAYDNYVKQVKNPLHLRVAGAISDTFYFHQIEIYIRDHQLSNYIEFMGDINNLEGVMQKAIALIIPSRLEGFGFCMPEAMFNNCLCIGNNIAGTKEQLTNGRNLTKEEIALSYTSEDELTLCLQKVHNSSEEQWKDMKERAFRTVNTLYTHERSAENIYSIYTKLLKENKK